MPRRVFAAYRLHFKAKGYSLLHRTARLFLPEFSTLTADIRVPSLPGRRAPADYSQNT
jgi:hypothetical protein